MGHHNHAFIGDNPSIPGDYNTNTYLHNGLSQKSFDSETLKATNSRNGSVVTDQTLQINNNQIISKNHNETTNPTEESQPEEPKKRDAWGNDIEFLMSCIAMSVGLGNVWRFPFTALENGGGAFLIPYLIVLFVVGRPIYYLEMIIGQFSSRGSVKVYDLSPAMRGIGIGQIIATAIASTYYVALMALTLKYFFVSFQSQLPWSFCNDDWGNTCVASGVGYGQVFAVFLLSTYYASLMAIVAKYLVDSFKNPLPWSICKPEWLNCIDSGGSTNSNNSWYSHENINGDRLYGSSELHYIREVLKEIDTIHNGIGLPDWSLTICLAIAWIIVLLILIKGVHSSGKAAYFLALFPYVVMIILLVRAVTLPGAADGILYFIRPQWDKILAPEVWYAAITQCFFSLSICFGNIIMYSSFNKFNHNVYRDATIVTVLDTFTSLLAGCTIFGILGHLAHEIGTTDIGSVVQGDTGLAFISYPDAIAKFDWLPQLFSVLFFFMLFILGIGSNVAMTSCIMTVIRDQFPSVKHWQAAIAISCVGIAIGSVYLTPGGQYILKLIDFFGASLIAFVLAIGELVAISWIYGVNRICKDTEFMIGRNPGLYWRLCWGILTPFLMIAILIYTIATYQPVTYRDYIYPNSAYAAGWTISFIGIVQLPVWAFYAIIKQNGNTWSEKITGAFKPTKNWGPSDPKIYEQYKKYLQESENEQMFQKTGIFYRFKRNIFG